jgi:hypothetical protein
MALLPPLENRKLGRKIIRCESDPKRDPGDKGPHWLPWNMEAEFGMLIVDTIAKIRRAYFVQKRSIKAICRELGVSRKVVRKVLRSDATEFKYERGSQPAPKIGPWRHQLDALLLANDSKAPRERLTLIRVFEELRALGYDGSYDAVRRYTKAYLASRCSG